MSFVGIDDNDVVAAYTVSLLVAFCPSFDKRLFIRGKCPSFSAFSISTSVSSASVASNSLGKRASAATVPSVSAAFKCVGRNGRCCEGSFCSVFSFGDVQCVGSKCRCCDDFFCFIFGFGAVQGIGMDFDTAIASSMAVGCNTRVCMITARAPCVVSSISSMSIRNSLRPR